MSISQACAMDVDCNRTCGSLDEGVVLNDAEIDVNDSLNINNDLIASSNYDSPSVDYGEGYYNQSNLTVMLNVNGASSVSYSWDNVSWFESNQSVSFVLNQGIYDLYYAGDGEICCQHYVVDCETPVVSSNFQSDLYYNPIQVSLSSIDNLDVNPRIYYTVDGSDPLENGILYHGLINISQTTSLKFYAEDFGGLRSPIVRYNYIFARVGNINSGKGFRTIQAAIDDNDTVNGDVIYIGPYIFYGPIYITKSLSLIGRGNPVITLKDNYPTINYPGGYYNQSNLTIELSIQEDEYLWYSWDNIDWIQSFDSINFTLTIGVYDLYYECGSEVVHQHYVIDDEPPLVWTNYYTDLYSSPILVNLSSSDNLDNNPKIYYTVDGSDPLENGILYQGLINISQTTSLKFYAEDLGGLRSSIVCYNYIFARVGNINSGKGFRTIQAAIDDNDTVDGDVIYIGPGIFYGPIYLTKSVSLIGRGNPIITLKEIYPTINHPGGCYNQSNLTIELSIQEDEYLWYSWDNIDWIQSFDSINFTLPIGVYDLYYEYGSEVMHQHYVIDNKAPLAWCNYYSDLYSNPILVNLSCWDNLDNDTKIYYTIDGSNPLTNSILYSNSINITSTTCLKFYAEDFAGLKSNVITCNYIFDNVANINSGKGFNTIQSAIDDVDTHDGDTIKVKEGLYQEHVTINKHLNLIGYNATLKGSSSVNPVIGVTNAGSNSIVYGFNIVNSTFGVVILNACNVSIMGNTFLNLHSSIETDGDVNSLIAYNTIDCDHYIGGMSGFTIRKSDNLTIFNNTISLNSNDDSVGIIITDGTSDNISITKNKILSKNSLKGIGVYVTCSNISIEHNTISNFTAALVISSSNSSIYNNCLNDNGYGLFLRRSINNTYKSNNIFNNLYGVFLHHALESHDDSFYLNRLCDNYYYDFFSQATCTYDIGDNWWGDNTPMISTNQYVLANVFNATGNLIMNSWIVMNLFSASYTIDDNSFVQRAQFYLDMTCNNIGGDLSYEGYLPDGLEALIYCFNNDANYKYNVSYLKQGKAFVDFELSDLFCNWENIYVVSHLDYGNVTRTFNKKATIDITLFSSAEDVDTEWFVNYTTSIDFTDNIYWITVSWSETTLYSGTINLIVNGEIIQSFNITNLFYQTYKNNYSSNVFEAIKFLNNVFASMKEGVWQPNGYYDSFAEYAGIDPADDELVYSTFLNYLQLAYNLTDDELNFVHTHKMLFIDMIETHIDYHGDITPDINFEYGGCNVLLSPPSGYVDRISNIYYTDIEDENNESIGYEGMRSFAIAKSNVTDDDLRYWLNQKEYYAPGLMKAAYGTFLTPLLVIYENDRVADDAAEKFNVTWSRISPVCVSLCNDYNCLYITGESDHLMGREAIGNSSSVWKFNFATSFSFSLVEQLVGNNVWNTTVIGSVTLGLLESYLNNETLEIITGSGYTVIKREGDNGTLLILEDETGIVHDYFSFYGLLGTMPCYHDDVSDDTWGYGDSILDKLSEEYKDLKNIFSISILSSVFVEGGAVVLEGVTGLSLGAAALIAIPLFIILCPDEANELWKELCYLVNPNYKDYPNITIYEGIDYNTQKLFDKPPVILVLNGQSLDEYIISHYKSNPNPKKDKQTIKNYNAKLNHDKNMNLPLYFTAVGGDSDDSDPGNWTNVGKYVKDILNDFNSLETTSEKVTFLKSHLHELLTLSLAVEASESIFVIIYSLIIWLLNHMDE